MGRNGVFQIILDLIKLVTKDNFLLPRPTTQIVQIFISLLFCMQITISNLFALFLAYFDFLYLDSMVLLFLVNVLICDIFFTLSGLLSPSRYSIIGTVRGLVHVISLDIFITIIYSILVMVSQSTNFYDFILSQNLFFNFIIFINLSFIFILILILESKKTPFDHAETEAEVVAGYSTEYSGPTLMMLYLAEYMHLVIASVVFVIFFLGGWNGIKFLFFLPIFFSPKNFSYFFMLI